MTRSIVLIGLLAAGCVSTGGGERRELAVGQTRHLTAYRADSCGAPPPSFADVAGRIPRSDIVRYSDGGLSSRVSNDCGRRVPTRAVNATGIKPGTETTRYQSGTVTIVVK